MLFLITLLLQGKLILAWDCVVSSCPRFCAWQERFSISDLVSLEGPSGANGPLLGRRGLICVSQDEPPSPEVIRAGKHELGIQSHEIIPKKLIRGRSGWGSTGYRVWGCDERDGKQD